MERFQTGRIHSVWSATGSSNERNKQSMYVSLDPDDRFNLVMFRKQQ